jgi:hypothetical protein
MVGGKLSQELKSPLGKKPPLNRSPKIQLLQPKRVQGQTYRGDTGRVLLKKHLITANWGPFPVVTPVLAWYYRTWKK